MDTRGSDYSYNDGYEDDVPLHRKQAFGSGIKRKRVEFVRAKDDDESAVGASQKRGNASAMGDLYASIVLGSSSSSSSRSSGSSKTKPDQAASTARMGDDSESREAVPAAPPSSSSEEHGNEQEAICTICSLSITGSVARHNASLAHQASLEHSHPPSALDRSRMGLRALKAQGWDPDARRGLGREGEGVRYPIKTAAKEDTLGIGAVIPPPGAGSAGKKEQARPPARPMGAKEMRRLAEEERRRGEDLHRELYGRVDVERYLRGDGGGSSGLT
ncbi:G-patch domain [Geosmithia morbida]|uniref:G-patch domain n=1 Tax=Geosmithia morbida TaxID=1094350 RepID=A0A9P4Z1M7_9HYPO|nr:G-patch domain [Geosmithia morbida]KAF4126930.1 G-patch domain [Geosmithia morbida]